MQRAGQDILRKVTRKAAANNRIINEPEAVSGTTKTTRCATAGQGDQWLRMRGCEEKASTRNEGQTSESRTRNRETPLSIPESEGVAKLAWVKNSHTESVETSSRGKSPSLCGIYTRRDHVTVEVHPDPKDKN